MSREKIGLKQSSTISAKAAYILLLESGYSPRLIDENKPLRSLNWESVIHDQNVEHSQSGKSIRLIDTTGQCRPIFDLKIKGMMSENSISFFQSHAHVHMKSST